jgi:hypothetical protein
VVIDNFMAAEPFAKYLLSPSDWLEVKSVCFLLTNIKIHSEKIVNALK